MTPKRRKTEPKPYAYGTKVSVAQSRAEIEKLLWSHGADKVIVGQERGGAGFVLFVMDGKQYKPRLPLRTNAGRNARDREQVERERWRALLLIVKAKLQFVAGGARSLHEEFLADLVLPDSTTMGEAMVPVVKQIYESGQTPLLLQAGS